VFFGYHLPNFTFPGSAPGELFDRFIDLVTTAEAEGFDMATVMDHVYQIAGIGPETEPMLEGWTTLGAMAARTSRIRLATLVTGVTYRNPAMLAKQVTTLDVISHGRAILGLGAAWNEDEHRGFGYGFPPVRERMDRLEEALTIARLMFTEERPSFEGVHYRIDGALNSPRPLQAGGPPIMVGGGGEQRTLRIAARFADITNWFGPLDVVSHKRDVFPLRTDRPRSGHGSHDRDHPARAGRNGARGEGGARDRGSRAPTFRSARNARDGGRLHPSVRRRRLRLVHLPDDDADDARGDSAGRSGDQAARRGSMTDGRAIGMSADGPERELGFQPCPSGS
jgi:F420-dependent oxidoreductase-like protein